MNLILLLILVLHGLVPVLLYLQPDPPTLLFMKIFSTWPKARTYCQTMYTDLAPVKTADDLQRIRDEVARQGSPSYIWIGLYVDGNSWRWSFHELYLSAKFLQKWAGGEPNNQYVYEQCATISSSGYWYDYTCDNLFPFICYNARYSGKSRFVGVTTPMNWTDARAYCRSFHTDLASSLEDADNSLLQQVAAGQSNTWFGLHRNGWTWTDHTTTQNISWASGEPDNRYGGENCGSFAGPLFDDVRCSEGHYFLCHYTPPIKRKMLKLQVKSDQNVFDAAVQSSLLMKIMKKLEAHGLLKDITVVWRVQPDGNVLHKKK